jgi:hypothetical protein
MLIIFFCLDFYKLIPKQIWKYKYHKNCFRKVISFNKSDGNFQLAVVKTHSGDWLIKLLDKQKFIYLKMKFTENLCFIIFSKILFKKLSQNIIDGIKL